MNRDVLLTRRAFVLRSATVTAAAAFGASLLAACAPGASNAPGGPIPPAATGSGAARSAASQKLQLPSLLPVQGPKPDLPGTDVIPNGYSAYPRDRFKAVPAPPGKGTDVTLITTVSNPLAPFESNTLWQGL